MPKSEYIGSIKLSRDDIEKIFKIKLETLLKNPVILERSKELALKANDISGIFKEPLFNESLVKVLTKSLGIANFLSKEKTDKILYGKIKREGEKLIEALISKLPLSEGTTTVAEIEKRLLQEANIRLEYYEEKLSHENSIDWQRLEKLLRKDKALENALRRYFYEIPEHFERLELTEEARTALDKIVLEKIEAFLAISGNAMPGCFDSQAFFHQIADSMKTLDPDFLKKILQYGQDMTASEEAIKKFRIEFIARFIGVERSHYVYTITREELENIKSPNVIDQLEKLDQLAQATSDIQAGALIQLLACNEGCGYSSMHHMQVISHLYASALAVPGTYSPPPDSTLHR